MIDAALPQQRNFIEEQFSKFEIHLDKIHKEVSANSQRILSFKKDHKDLSKRVSLAEESIQDKHISMEVMLVQHEDQSRRDNIRLMNLLEKIEGNDPVGFITASLPNWFPTLTDVKFEATRAHRLGPECNSGPPRTFICKMLRSTDRGKLLKASRSSPVTVAGKELHFAADYNNYTARRRREYGPFIEKAKKQGFSTFLLYPAKLKLTRGVETHLFHLLCRLLHVYPYLYIYIYSFFFFTFYLLFLCFCLSTIVYVHYVHIFLCISRKSIKDLITKKGACSTILPHLRAALTKCSATCGFKSLKQ